MQLVYLYIEKYKNIINKGFHFSSQFKCEYKDKLLHIEENSEYIKNFFGDNIEISAIVGANGSGKSSILESILKIIEEELSEKYISKFEIKSNIHKRY